MAKQESGISRLLGCEVKLWLVNRDGRPQGPVRGLLVGLDEEWLHLERGSAGQEALGVLVLIPRKDVVLLAQQWSEGNGNGSDNG